MLCKGTFWTELYDDWWGAPMDAFGDVVEVKQKTVWSHLGHLSQSEGKIYVREEYKAMYSRMEEASRLSPPRGVIIAGQSGIGAFPLL